MTQSTEQATDDGGVTANLAQHGKVSYLRIPAVDAVALSAFYEKVFGWQVGGRPEHVSFTDASGELIGAFEPDEVPPRPGVLPHLCRGDRSGHREHRGNGGTVVQPVYDEGGLWVATFRDPAAT
jgi:predicted enzyme related to lactoylglutathione lyase